MAELLGTSACALNSTIYKRPELAVVWRRMPADGAFAGRFAGLPRPIGSQSVADGLVAEAIADLAATGHPLDPKNSQASDALRLILAMYAITGTMNFARGWVRSAMVALAGARGVMPSAKVVRWYKSNLASDPTAALDLPGVDNELIQDLVDRG
ncbi:MAG: hypothetical protein AAF340_06430 [Pseudomonadota bacterium]